MEVDTGASVSTLRRSNVNALQIFLPLEPAGRPLLNYDQSALQGVWGTISTRVQFGGREAKVELHVVSQLYGSILGRDFLQGLRIVVDCGEGQVQLVGQLGTLKHPGDVYPKLFGGTVGTFPNYQHRIQLKEDAVPSVSRLRSIPLARKEQVLEEIRKMDNEKIWEPVQRSEWVHGLVTVPKEGGGGPDHHRSLSTEPTHPAGAAPDPLHQGTLGGPAGGPSLLEDGLSQGILPHPSPP